MLPQSVHAGALHGASGSPRRRLLRQNRLENVLLTSDGVVKVIDFGLSHIYAKGANGQFDRSIPLKEMCGSKSYAAPEVLSGAGQAVASTVCGAQPAVRSELPLRGFGDGLDHARRPQVRRVSR